MQIQANYTEELVRRATMRFWTRFIGWHGFAVIALMTALLTYLLIVWPSILVYPYKYGFRPR